jgi:hypothetical protein
VPDLLLHGREVHTVFDLLGDKENDITYALGWALSRSNRLLSVLLAEVLDEEAGEIVAVRLQEFLPGGGCTDIEVETEHLHLIIEAKRGWNLPATEQLELYAPRFSAGRANAIVSMSECSPEWALPRLPATVGADVPVKHLSWKRVTQLAVQAEAGGSQVEKRLLREFVRYLRGLMTMQNTTSNMVYVVSLGLDDLFDSSVSFADIVVKHNRYFHPIGGGRGGWPKEPPNYLGFRFHGKLQQIRHVEGYDVHPRPWDEVPGLIGKPKWEEGLHFFYDLGPAIEPPREVKMGKLWPSARVWAALDLLLTCDTISEARDKTTERLAAAGAG